MGMYRKKPVVIEAVQYTGKNQNEISEFCPSIAGAIGSDSLFIATLEGEMEASVGDWIIKGVKGEFYPCKPDIFAATYGDASSEPADNSDEIGEWVKKATTLLSDAIGGGSEMFRRHGDKYRIDPEFVAQYIRKRREDHHEAMHRNVRRIRELEDQLAALNQLP